MRCHRSEIVAPSLSDQGAFAPHHACAHAMVARCRAAWHYPRDRRQEPRSRDCGTSRRPSVRERQLTPDRHTAAAHHLDPQRRQVLTNVRKLRAVSFNRQRERCIYCEQPMWLTDQSAFARRYGLSLRRSSRHQATTEHLRSRCEGGGNEAANIAVACRYCNQKRHGVRRSKVRSPAEHRDHVQTRRALKAWHGFWPLSDVICDRTFF